jgi:hypothetical protein
LLIDLCIILCLHVDFSFGSLLLGNSEEKLKCTSSCKFSCSTAFCVCRLFQFSFGEIQFF